MDCALPPEPLRTSNDDKSNDLNLFNPIDSPVMKDESYERNSLLNDIFEEGSKDMKHNVIFGDRDLNDLNTRVVSPILEDPSDDEDYGVFVEDADSDVDHCYREKEKSVSEEQAEAKKIRIQIESFDAAMRQSFKTQQRIHRWDRKMGLRRSHSKTMRLSMKSRKRLHKLLQRDIIHLSYMDVSR